MTAVNEVKGSQAELAGYYAYRIRVAATGVVLIVATFLTTLPAWLNDGPSATGIGTGPPDSWNLWAIADGSITGSETGIATWAAVLLVITLLLSLFAASEARWAWALAAAIGGTATFVLIFVLRGVALEVPSGQYVAPNAANGGMTGAMWAVAVLVFWALLVSRSAWLRREIRDRLTAAGGR